MEKRRNDYVMLCVNGESIFEHRYVMEQYLCRKLLPTEQVHHINGIKYDNRIENLELCTAQDHADIHADRRRFEKLSNRAKSIERKRPVKVLGKTIIETERIKRGKSSKEMACFLGITENDYMIKEINIDFTVREIKALSIFFNCTIDYLLSDINFSKEELIAT